MQMLLCKMNFDNFSIMHACKILVIQSVAHNLTGVVYGDLTSLCFCMAWLYLVSRDTNPTVPLW